MTSELLELMRERDFHLKHAQKSNSDYHWNVREDGSLLFIVEVVIVKRKHGACVQKPEHEEELYEREFMCLCCVLCNKFVQNQCMK